ncbi:aspartyl protease family protein [Candidatus Dojkabacteria bacterium]|nr:aspartyl protease family protein [Candidatus Dojkabacteria bacterium]
MGLTYITVKLVNPKNTQAKFKRKFLVDSGATYSVVDANVLKTLKVESIRTQKFILANGEEIKKDIGEITFIYKGDKATSPVVFGDDNIFLLGAVTLESFGFIVDPLNRKLKKLPMLI